jgi:hypothetical protein
MTIFRIAVSLICLLILTSNGVSMSRWSETRGVYDDVCYLRQAHLFQRFGITGLDTNISRDDDHYFQGRLKAIDFADWNDPKRWPCHNPMPDGKIVIQYPPGTGFLLALFPEANQVAPLYIVSSLIVCGLALLGIWSARSILSIICAGVLGASAVLFMINPAKESYSMPPTLAVCAIAGYLTALWFTRARQSVWLPMLIGLLLGLSVNFRLPNLWLSAGYVVFLGAAMLWSPAIIRLAQGLGFGVAAIAGMAPTLIAQAINAGSPFATTYGSVDALAPSLDLVTLGRYLRDLQFGLIVLATGSAALMLWKGEGGLRQAGLVVAGNLAINLVFFLSHPIFTHYYIVPIAMLSLWSACFAWLMQSALAAKRVPAHAPARAEAFAQ